MAEISHQVEIPNRALFKASEVCDLAKVQPYVLRSWEAEFKDLGVARSGSASRVYRREDIERVLRIKHLLLVDGLTLAGVRRKLDEESEAPLEEQVETAEPPTLSTDARERISGVKRGLQSLLDLLDVPVAAHDVQATPENGALPLGEFLLAPPESDETASTKSASRSAGKDESVKSSSPRRKRSA